MDSINHLLEPPHADLEVCVIIPAKDEASRLERTLNALAAQVDFRGGLLARERWETILLVNNSTDNSFSLAKSFQESHSSFRLHVLELNVPAEHAHIGYIRKLLLDTACERLLHRPKPFSMMLSTDGDTEAAPDWAAQNQAEIRMGAEAVGGRILLQPHDLRQLDQQTRNIQMKSDKYNLLVAKLEDECDPQPHDPWPRHYQHFGSSFALKPEVYRRVGGLPAREYLEDVALYEALTRQDVRFRHSPLVCVHTAGRLEGRTAVGLAEQLTRWREGSCAIQVPSVLLWHKLFSFRSRVRRLWHEIQRAQDVRSSATSDLAKDCGLSAEELRETLTCQWFGMAFEKLDVRRRLEESLAGETRQLLDDAIADLLFQLEKLNPILRFSELPDALPLR